MASTNFQSIDWDVLKAHVAETCHVWQNTLRSTEPLDRERTARAIVDLYGLIDLPAPQVVWCQSPWQASVIKGVLEFDIPRDVKVHPVHPDPAESESQARIRQRFAPTSNEFQVLWEKMWQQLDQQVSAERQSLFKANEGVKKKTQPSSPAWLRAIPFMTDMMPDFEEIFKGTGNLVRTAAQKATHEIGAVCHVRLEGESGFAALEREYRASMGARLDAASFRQIQAASQALSIRSLIPLIGTSEERNDSRWDMVNLSVAAVTGNLQKELDKVWNPGDGKIWRFVMTLASEQVLPDIERAQCMLLPLYKCVAEQADDIPFGPTNRRRLTTFLDLLAGSSSYTFTESLVFASERPITYEEDGNGRLHSETGAAVEFQDGFNVYSWHGSTVPRNLIEHPEWLNVRQILKEPNVEVRRVMIERFGPSRFVEESGAEVVHQDECGVLYRKTLANDEPLVMVKVLNSTPEPDGSVKTYFLRVPPTMRTAREAVAWTFDRSAADYAPTTET